MEFLLSFLAIINPTGEMGGRVRAEGIGLLRGWVDPEPNS